MRQNSKDRMPHETRDIIAAQIMGELPIGPAANFAGGGRGPAVSFPRGMQINYAECSELIGPSQRRAYRPA
jgi:hypothetical protein